MSNNWNFPTTGLKVWMSLTEHLEQSVELRKQTTSDLKQILNKPLILVTGLRQLSFIEKK